jgi:hypothetical protein
MDTAKYEEVSYHSESQRIPKGKRSKIRLLCVFSHHQPMEHYPLKLTRVHVLTRPTPVSSLRLPQLAASGWTESAWAFPCEKVFEL